MLTVVTTQLKGKVSTQAGCWSRRGCFLETLASLSETLTSLQALQICSWQGPARWTKEYRNIGILDDLDPRAYANFVSQSCEPSWASQIFTFEFEIRNSESHVSASVEHSPSKHRLWVSQSFGIFSGSHENLGPQARLNSSCPQL